MSELNDKSVTHDSFGAGPAAANLTVGLVWRDADKTNSTPANTAPVVLSKHFDTEEKRDWNNFKKALHLVARGQGFALTDHVTYLDSDGDEIPIESQCEFEEALKYAKTIAAEQQSLILIVEKNNRPEVAVGQGDIDSSEEACLVHLGGKTDPQKQNQFAMPPMRLDNGFGEAVHRQWQSQVCSLTLPTRTEGLGDKAPEWFINYMQNMKEEIVTEVSTRVTKTVMDALHKKRESQYDSATSHPRASDTDCLLDSDPDDVRSVRFPVKSRTERINLLEQSSSNGAGTREKRISEASSRSAAAFCFDNTRRRYRHADKQRKKHNKNNGSQTSYNDETWHSPSVNRRRSEKTAKKRETDETIGATSSANSLRAEKISTPRSSRDSRENADEPANPYRRIIDPAPSEDSTEPPVLKLRLANCHVEAKLEEDALRMGCSVTGQDMFERPTERILDYALSDSDNISIISDVSHASDMEAINNNFEMIIHRPTTIADSAALHSYDDPPIDRRCATDRPAIVTLESANTDVDADDLDNTRDSSSFELLSEPPSPALSIYMDEDHFSPGKNETSNYNINADTSVDKRGNQSKIEICPYAIDAQGKIYQQNIVDVDEISEEIVLEKRSGGAYSFVGETLPGSTKESVILTEDRSEPIGDEMPDAASGNSNESTCDVGIEVTVEATIDSHGGQSADAFHESTQSFHSHTAPQAENDRRDFGASASSGERGEAPCTPRSHVFIDRNASKGLGDTKRSSPRKQAASGNKNSDEARSDRQRSNRKPSHESHASGNRGSNQRHGERSRRFADWSTTRTRMMDDIVFNAVDPMHILPETLVTGAVHVASSAYTTARRVYDKILTAQTRKPADKSKFGRR